MSVSFKDFTNVFPIEDKPEWCDTEEGERGYWETADLWTPLKSPKERKVQKSTLNEANGQWEKEPNVRGIF